VKIQGKRSELKTRPNKSAKSLPFRKYYANNDDTKISNILFYFFSSVRDTFTKSTGDSLWKFHPEKMTPSNVLHTTVGYLALLDILNDIIKATNDENSLFTKEYYNTYLEKAKNLNFENIERYPFTSKTKLLFYLDLSVKIFPSNDVKDERLLRIQEILKTT
jgi:hypothetical protein